MTTLQAFAQLIGDAELCRTVKMSDENRRQWVHKMKNRPEAIRIEAMTKWLVAAGFKCLVDWTAPEQKTPGCEPGATPCLSEKGEPGA